MEEEPKMNKKLSRILSLALSVVVMASALVGCGSKPAASSGSSSSSSSESTSTEAPVETRVLKLSHHCTEGDSNDILFNKFAELVKEKTNGEIEIDIYANGQLYGQKDALEALKLGTLDLAMSDTALWANYDPACGVMDMPYMFKSREHAIKVASSDIIEPIKERLVESAGIRPILVECLNFRNSFVKDMSIDSFEDFKGLKMRTPEAPMTIAAFEAIGANPVVIPSGEAYTAVQTGVADGLEGHAEYMVLQKFYEVAKNYVLTQHVMTFTALNMSEQVYQTLTDSQKEAFAEAGAEALEYFYEYTDKLFEEKFAELEANGVKITDIDRTPFEEACAPFIQNFIEENDLQDVYDAIMEAAE